MQEKQEQSNQRAGTRYTWDAGELGCGELIIQLKLQLSCAAPGDVLEVTAYDAGAREDIPAWCRVTGNRLLEMNPPHYSIERKG